MSESVRNALFSYPPQAAFGRTLPKNKLYEKAGANSRLKDLFVSQVEQIVWQYKLRTALSSPKKITPFLFLFKQFARSKTLIAESQWAIGQM